MIPTRGSPLQRRHGMTSARSEHPLTAVSIPDLQRTDSEEGRATSWAAGRVAAVITTAAETRLKGDRAR